MRDLKILFSARDRGAGDVGAAGRGADRPHRRHRQGYERPADQGRHRRRREPGVRAFVVHGDHRRPGRYSMIGLKAGIVEGHRVGSRLRRLRPGNVPIKTIGAPMPPVDFTLAAWRPRRGLVRWPA